MARRNSWTSIKDGWISAYWLLVYTCNRNEGEKSLPCQFIKCLTTKIIIILGRKFDKNGDIVKEWWSKSSLMEFNKKSECIEKQYSMYKVQGKYPVRSVCWEKTCCFQWSVSFWTGFGWSKNTSFILSCWLLLTELWMTVTSKNERQ